MFNFFRRQKKETKPAATETNVQTAEPDGRKKRCPKCHQEYPVQAITCDQDQTLLMLVQPIKPAVPETIVAARLDGTRWELLVKDFLGRGSICDVFEALDNATEERFAVKAMKVDLMFDKKSARKFLEGAKNGLLLQHENIVATLATGSARSEKDDCNRPFMVCEYLEGKPLSHLINKDNRATAAETLTMARQVCSALEHAHGQGITHSDLKPANIHLQSIAEKDIVKVSDFAIAERLFQGLEWNQVTTVTSSLYGSAVYLAPDYAQGRTPTAAADIYALGCIMYECMTGQPPFLGANDFVTIMQHMHDQPRPFEVNHVPDGLEALIMRALEKDPARRWRSAAEMGEAIDILLAR